MLILRINRDRSPHGKLRRRSRHRALSAAAMLFAASMSFTAFAGVKQVAYPEIKVTINHPYEPDAAFKKMHAAFAGAVAKKDQAALSDLVAPMFFWTVDGAPADGLELGRSAIDNFKVVFGFRAPGKDEDGGVVNGPFWDALEGFAGLSTFYTANDAGSLVCGPLGADIVDPQAFEQARKKVETGDEAVDWYFTLRETAVAKAPGDTGAPIAKVGVVAMPLIGAFPAATQGQPAPQITHVEVLLPSGKSGWVPANSVLPMVTDRLCFAKTPKGEWKLALIDQAG
jgi:hypothetical protein